MFTSPAQGELWTFLVVLAAWTPGPLQAQVRPRSENPIRFERLDGLSHNTVLAITQDREGFLWIGTLDGLNRFDGYSFAVYRHDRPDSTSLSNNSVKALLTDRFGDLWVGTDGGLDRFDPRSDGFVRYALGQNGSDSRRLTIHQLVEDHAGRLWIAANMGLYRYERDEGRFRAYRHNPGDASSLAGDDVGSLHEGQGRSLWIGTQGVATLHRFDEEADNFIRFQVPHSWFSVGVRYVDQAGRIWVSDVERTGAFEPSTGYLSQLGGIPSNRTVKAVLDDRYGLRWIGTDDGLYRCASAAEASSARASRVQDECTHLRLDPSPDAYLQNYVRALYEDRAGALWAGTSSGLYRLDSRTKAFFHLGQESDNSGSQGDWTVMSVLEDSAGILWVGTLGGGLDRVDRAAGKVTRYRHRASDPYSLCHDLIWFLHEDRRGRLWIATDAGLCALDRQTGRFETYELPVEDDHVLRPLVHAIREDHEGRLWIASKVGLYRLDPQTEKVAWYARPSGDVSFSARLFYLQSIHIARDGYLWMGAYGGTLYRMDPATAEFKAYPVFAEVDESVGEGIWAIHEDAGGYLWLGSDQGLARLDPRSGAVRLFSRREGLPGSAVYAILQEDILGHLWISTNRGLARYNEGLHDSLKFRVYDTGDGLVDTEFNRRSGFKAADGTFYFGGLKGVTWFHPTAIRANPVAPPVVITRIEISNRDTTVTEIPYGLEELVLSYRDYTVSFEYAALNFTNPSKNRYRYQLEGFDSGWIDAGSRRFARYTNLPPGAYTFRVIGSNNDGIWNEDGGALRLRITPPFWQTWWFRLLVATLLIGILTAAYRYRVAHLLEFARMRLRIAGDLHDDIGSNLGSIALLSDIVGESTRLDEQERAQLSTIGRSARTMAENLRDIVWSIEPENDSADDLVLRMQDAAAALLNGTNYTFLAAGSGIEGVLDMDARRHVLLTYKEMLHNITRHSDATSVSIKTEDCKGQFVLTVSDNGIGFDEATVRKGSGLRHIRERALRIGGSLDIDTVPGKGTTIRLVVPASHHARKRRERVMRGGSKGSIL